ncbi:MAG TPA: L-dopachrome tautomerase-related protein [Caulobacteraceae bacterium]|nr:L-dopachrome tautomerase-related protein [Caulobacteraceae bacterium]
MVAALPGVLLNGVAVSPTGRIFISVPRWQDVPTPGVIELLPGGSHRPFPGNDWNAWRTGQPAENAFVSVHSISADQDGNLWVVDEGPPFHGRPSTTAAQDPYAGVLPKIVQIDIASGKVVQTYPIDREAAPPGSNFGHVRIDGRFLYVSEPGIGSVIVIDRRTKAIHRRLAGVKAAKADPTVMPSFAGVPIAPAGEAPQIHLDHMEIDAKGEKLFFMSLFGPTLYSIKIADLTNWSLSDQDLEKRISVEGPVPAATGLRKDAKGDLYICSITDFAIMRRTPNGSWEIVARDPRIYIPNNPSFGPDGSLYFPVSRPPGIPDIGVDGPPAVYRVKLDPGESSRAR